MSAILAAPKPVQLVAQKDVECWYEYASGAREVLATGHRLITDANDPRWDGELLQKPFQGNPQGYLGVYEVTRVDGEVVKKVGLCGYSYTMNKAREFMRAFQERKAAGDGKPWDQESYFRDIKRQAEEAKSAGRREELELLGQMFRTAVLGQTPEVTE